MKFPLFFPLIFWILGILGNNFFSFSPKIIILCSIINLLFILIFKKFKQIFLLILIFFCAILSSYQTFPANHLKSIFSKTSDLCYVNIKGIVVSEPNKEKNNFSFEVALIQINDIKTKGKILFYTKDTLRYKDEFSSKANLFLPSKAQNPYAFDYREYLAEKDIYALGENLSKIEIVKNKINFFDYLLYYPKKYLENKIEVNFAKEANFVKALLIGEKKDLKEKKEIFANAGLSHILAISGLHVGIVSLFIFFILNIFSFCLSKKIIRLLLIIILIFYSAICNFSPSIVRASIMISLFLLSKNIQRKLLKENLIIVSLFFTLIIWPSKLFSLSLLLSYSAVFALIVIIPIINQHLKIKNHLLKYILDMLLISFIISLISLPIILYNFNQINFNGIISNLLAIPLVSLLIPNLFLALFLPKFLSSLFVYSSLLLIKIMDFWTIFSAKLPFIFSYFSFNLGQVLLLYLVFLLLIFYLIYKKWKNFILILSSLLLIFVFIFNNLETKDLEITLFSVDFGDAAYIQQKNGVNFLIDLGNVKSQKTYFEYEVFPYLKKGGINKIDYLMITHAHLDHYGGIFFALNNLKIKNILISDDFQKQKIYDKLLPILKDKKVNIIALTDTMSLNFNDLNIKFLHPDKNYFDNNKNNMSLVFNLKYKNFSALFTGDIEKEAENYILAKYPNLLESDFLKIAHHGSKTSSTYDFLKKVSPKFAFISIHLGNKFKFPSPKVKNNLDSLKIKDFIAGKNGALMISTNGFKTEAFSYSSQENFKYIEEN